MEELDLIQIIINKLEEKFKSNFKHYYYGRPDYSRQSETPYIAVDEPSIPEITFARLGEDKVTESISILVVVNKKDRFTRTLNHGDSSLKRIKDLVIGFTRSSTTNKLDYNTDTIVGYLRQQITLSNSSGQSTILTPISASVTFDDVEDTGSIFDYAIIRMDFQRTAGVTRT